jgi:hypothetical protein
MPRPSLLPPGLLLAFLLGLAVAGPTLAEPFTYQGELRHQGRPADGLFDFRVTPFDLPEGGIAQAAPMQLDAVPVGSGRFTLALDFGSVLFDGRELHLAIEVRVAGTPEFAALLPRQPVTPTPYALFARNALPASGSVGSAAIDPSQVQRRIASSCTSGQAMAGVAQDGTPTCVATGEDDWYRWPDGSAVTARRKVSIGTDGTRGAQLLVMGNSGVATPQVELVEQDYDYARFTMGNTGPTGTSHFGTWTLAARTYTGADGGPGTDRINFFNNRSGDVMSLLGNGRLGIGVFTPAAALDVNGNARIRGLSGSGTRSLSVNAAGELVTGSTAVLSVQAAEWVANQSNIAISRLARVTPLGSPGSTLALVAPVKLPHGAVVTGWRLWYQNRVTPSMEITLFRYANDGAPGWAILSRLVASVDSTTAMREHAASIPEHTIDLQASNYMLHAMISSGNWQQDQHTIGTVLIEYRMP